MWGMEHTRHDKATWWSAADEGQRSLHIAKASYWKRKLALRVWKTSGIVVNISKQTYGPTHGSDRQSSWRTGSCRYHARALVVT